ncbi:MULTISPECIES: hypothetical protein [unclassified Variovorax]|uniref:hypothetical protein n=1 Tax=unclassified Variovorax TaxID=663243 RepID=UPI002578CC2D|nr:MULTISPECIES: hypothetical protein [unclassified Variovorax]MDM0091540.1 hypothetical protein [Variovorax sp. J22G40]MDM0148743.1 hypothetical protein [Variovorax sp. J2P1-31]
MGTLQPRPQTTLQDKYAAQDQWVYMTGMQALVRLPLQQRARDQAQGWNTAGYISGYRGSPMGRYDMDLWAAQRELDEANVVFRPGLNEDLAATAIWGSQQVGNFAGAKVDGVFGIWYGKGPGVDRSGDVLRHANQAGTSPRGGVICLAGDDHGAKSSTVANFSDPIFMAVGIPVLYPSNTQELLNYGLHGIAMSRYSGCWVAIKVVTDVVEGGGSVRVGVHTPEIRLPEAPAMPADAQGKGVHIRAIDMPLPQEARLYNVKIRAALDYARLNGLNHISVAPAVAHALIVSSGKAWQDLQQALAHLGWNEPRLERAGIRLLKIGMTWPLDPDVVRTAASGVETVIVVEEKRPILEDQIRSILYGQASPPEVVGKHMHGSVFDPERGPVAFPDHGEISPPMVAQVLQKVLGHLVIDALVSPSTGVPKPHATTQSTLETSP